MEFNYDQRELIKRALETEIEKLKRDRAMYSWEEPSEDIDAILQWHNDQIKLAEESLSYLYTDLPIHLIP